MKTHNFYLKMTAVASLMFCFNAFATTATQTTTKVMPATSVPILSGGVAPSGLTDEQFKAGLSIDSYVENCKKNGGDDDIIVKSLVSFHAGKHMLVVTGKIVGQEYPSVGEYKKAPSNKQINSLLGLKFCSY